LAEHFVVGKIEKSLCSIDGNFYLFGNVVRASKLPKKGVNAAYDVVGGPGFRRNQIDCKWLYLLLNCLWECVARNLLVARRFLRKKYRPEAV
jgi:hypothetical protein